MKIVSPSTREASSVAYVILRCGVPVALVYQKRSLLWETLSLRPFAAHREKVSLFARITATPAGTSVSPRIKKALQRHFRSSQRGASKILPTMTRVHTFLPYAYRLHHRCLAPLVNPCNRNHGRYPTTHAVEMSCSGFSYCRFPRLP